MIDLGIEHCSVILDCVEAWYSEGLHVDDKSSLLCVEIIKRIRDQFVDLSERCNQLLAWME